MRNRYLCLILMKKIWDKWEFYLNEVVML
jgi:hypothetical protein